MNHTRDYESKNERVKKIFTDIARNYDRVNTVISFGQIGRWRNELVEKAPTAEGGRVLEIGCGTGQLTRLMADHLPVEEIVGVDITPEMIERAREGLPSRYSSRVRFIEGRGESLDFPTNYFDLVTSAFTLRNVESIESVVSEMERVVKPGGKVVNLELSSPTVPVFRHFYSIYFNYIMPLVGGVIHGSTAPYRYLTESVRKFPDQEDLKKILEESGLINVRYENLLGGVAAIHCGEGGTSIDDDDA
ncbi:MAG: ubiquinone/menaquinone biosynthesis methyltransferase [Candidatus Acetothermia bacterium]